MTNPADRIQSLTHRIHMRTATTNEQNYKALKEALDEIDNLAENMDEDIARIAAEHDRLLAYARELESIVEDAQRDNRMIDDVVDLRVEHGVADIMATDREGTA